MQHRFIYSFETQKIRTTDFTTLLYLKGSSSTVTSVLDNQGYVRFYSDIKKYLDFLSHSDQACIQAHTYTPLMDVRGIRCIIVLYMK